MIDNVSLPNGNYMDYDARGNLIQTTEDATSSFFAYNGRDMMLSATMPVVGQIDYRYDHDARRIKQSNGGTTTNYLWDELSAYGDVVWESNGTISSSYVLGGTGLIAQKVNSTVSYFLPDALGSTRTLTNATGNITDTYTYEAFGEVLSQSGTTDTSYLYAGQQFDELSDQTWILR